MLFCILKKNFLPYTEWVPIFLQEKLSCVFKKFEILIEYWNMYKNKTQKTRILYTLALLWNFEKYFY